jgi:hypothetical protein
VVVAALQTDQTVLFGVATDEAIAAVQLRAVIGRRGKHHRVADAIEPDAGWPAEALEAGLTVTTVDRVREVLEAALELNKACAIAADFVLAAIVILAAVNTDAFAVAEAIQAILVVAALGAIPAAAVPVWRTVAVMAALSADAALGLVIVAADELPAT